MSSWFNMIWLNRARTAHGVSHWEKLWPVRSCIIFIQIWMQSDLCVVFRCTGSQFLTLFWYESINIFYSSDRSYCLCCHFNYLLSFKDTMICFQLRTKWHTSPSCFTCLVSGSNFFLLSGWPAFFLLTGFHFSWLGISRPHTVLPIVPVSVSSVGER